VRKATLKGPRKPPKDTTQMAIAAALAQADAAVRVKGRTMVELILNTPYEAFAKKVAKIFEEHGTVSLGARKYTEEYYEWQLIVRLDLKDWGFLVECKKSMRVPEFVKTDEELRAYLAMMLACEGHITWAAANTKVTDNPTTTFYVVPITSTNEQLVLEINDLLRSRGFNTNITNPTNPQTTHVDSFGRLFESKIPVLRVQMHRTDEVKAFLTWLGKVPHPIKEAYRLWALRLLEQAAGIPIKWSQSTSIKNQLDEVAEKAARIGRERAKEHYIMAQKKIDSGEKVDTRPRKAQTAPHSYGANPFGIPKLSNAHLRSIFNKTTKTDMLWKNS